MAERVEVVIAGRDRASGRHDVVLQDADALVDATWLDKVRRCAATDARIGTVVPWSGQTLAPGSHDVRAVNAALERATPRLYPDADAMEAPCIFLRGRVLREIGGAQALRDPRSVRARVRAAGYRNVLCDDAFVGRRSADPRPHGAPLALAPLARLARTQLAIDARRASPGILHVLHSRGGGTEKYVRSIVGASRSQFRHYYLRVAHDRWLFKDASGEHAAACEWPRDATGEHCLRSMCAWLAIDFVHVHSLVGSGEDLVRMIAATGLPYGYSVHDMYLPCPTVYLIDASGAYCNATTDVRTCTECLARMPAFRDTDIAQWRTRYAQFLRRADKVWAPSRWAAETLREYYPDANIAVRPHPVQFETMCRPDVDVLDLPLDQHRHIAVLGAIGPEKGARNIDALVDTIRRRALPLRLVVVGFTDRARRFQSDDRVLTIHGSYGQDELAQLFAGYRIDAVLFPTIWPETFSYTLSEAWRAGRPVFVPPRGALAERVEATGAGWLMRGWPDIDAIADQLVESTGDDARTQLQSKSALARAAADAESSGGAVVPYEAIAPATARAPVDAATLYGIYAAACRAMSVAPSPLPAAATRAAPASAFDRLLRMVTRA